MGSASGRTRLASLAASLLLALVFLWPTLRLPYLGDDVFNANVDGWMGYERLSPGTGFARFFVLTNAEAGRFYPLWSLLTFGEFHFIHGVSSSPASCSTLLPSMPSYARSPRRRRRPRSPYCR